MPNSEEAPQRFRYTLFHAIGLVIFFALLQSLLVVLLQKINVAEIDSSTWLGISIANGISGLLTAKAGAILAGRTLSSFFPAFQFRAVEWISILLSSVGISILSSELANILQSIKPIDQSYLDLLKQLMKQNFLGMLFAISVVAPVTEELIFRGVILDGLRTRYGPWLSITLSAFLFGVIHLLPWLILNSFLLGLFLGWLRVRRGLLLPCLVVHALFNALPFLLLKVFSMEVAGYTTISDVPAFHPLWLDVLGAVLLFAGIAGIRQSRDATRTTEAAPFSESGV